MYLCSIPVLGCCRDFFVTTDSVPTACGLAPSPPALALALALHPVLPCLCGSVSWAARPPVGRFLSPDTPCIIFFSTPLRHPPAPPPPPPPSSPCTHGRFWQTLGPLSFASFGHLRWRVFDFHSRSKDLDYHDCVDGRPCPGQLNWLGCSCNQPRQLSQE